MADDDKDSLAYFPSYQIPLPGIKAAVSGVQQGYGSGTENDQTVLDLAVAGGQQLYIHCWSAHQVVVCMLAVPPACSNVRVNFSNTEESPTLPGVPT